MNSNRSAVFNSGSGLLRQQFKPQRKQFKFKPQRKFWLQQLQFRFKFKQLQQRFKFQQFKRLIQFGQQFTRSIRQFFKKIIVRI